jgi:hypothetical protein
MSGDKVFRLVYVSRSLVESEDKSERLRQVQDILRQSKRKNPSTGVTGALFFDGLHFGQVLEGPADAVRGTMANISRDRRHTNIDIVSEASEVPRVFGDWSMALIHDCGGPTIALQLTDPTDPKDVAWQVSATQHALIAEICRFVQTAA